MHKNNDRQQSRSPQYTGQGAIKSQKNINIPAAMHMKTEADKGDDDVHRSPDLGRSEMRDTWRRPRIPYNKLPQVFNQQKQKNKYGKKVKQDMLKNLDKLVQNSEYKQAQKYLEPLKYKQQQKRKDLSENRNPLNPVKLIIKRANKQIKEMQDMTFQQFKNNRIGPKISECVTLQIVKRSHNTGTIKKMLHVPTLTLVCIRQQPITVKQSRNFIRDWTNIWRQRLSEQGMPFITIHDVLYNYPEGAISIFTEYFKSRSLLNLLDLTMTLPESVVRQIFQQVIKCLQIFYAKTNTNFGGLSPSQIMFAQNNKIKLSLGLFYHMSNLDSNQNQKQNSNNNPPESNSNSNIYNIKLHHKTNLFDFSQTLTKFLKNSLSQSFQKQQQNLDLQKSIDIFKIGLCALQCVIGSFQNYEQSYLLFQSLKYVFTQQGQRLVQIDNLCCLVHSESYLLQNIQTSDKYPKKVDQKQKKQKYISYLKLIKDRFSIHLINFLCGCLKLSHNKRSNINELLNSSFIHSPHDNDNKTVKIELIDLLSIQKNMNKDIPFQINPTSQQKMNNFLIHVRNVLQNCNKQVLKDLLTNNKTRIYQLGKQIGLSSQMLGKKLEALISDVIKNNINSSK